MSRMRLATLAYDATNLMLAAIEKAGVDDPAQVAKAMEGLKYDAVSGTITFDPQHNPIKSAVVIAGERRQEVVGCHG